MKPSAGPRPTDTLGTPGTRSHTISPSPAAAATQVAIGGVDRSIERFATTRTVVGERLRALDAHEQALESGSIEAQSRLSALVDVDFARAVSELTQNQTTLQAAMQSYAQVSKMTLFDYL